MNNARVGGNAQRHSDNNRISILQQTGIDDDEHIEGCEQAVDPAGNENQRRDQNEIEEKLNIVNQIGMFCVLPEKYV